MVAPLRNSLLQVNGLTDLRTRTRDESAVLYLDFPFGVDPDLAFIEVNEKIDRAMNQLPRDVERPRVLASDVSDIPVFQLAVTFRDSTATDEELLQLSELAQKVFRRRLEQIPEIAFADLSGQLEPRLIVRPNRAALRALGLADADLARLLMEANLDLGNLLLQDGAYEFSVRFTGQLQTAEDLRQLYLDIEGRLVALDDLAEVALEPRPARGRFLHNGRPGIVFAVRKRSAARLFALRENLQGLLTDLRKEYPELAFDLNNDQTAILRASIDNLSTGLLYGAGAAILILFAFFREWRRPLLIGLAVPIALLIALLGFYLAGLSINVISLAGLILGLGLMIDNSIIVLDNTRQKVTASDRSSRLSQTAAAANEVIRPLISSALTTIAVFLPLVLLSGIAGALFRDQAIAVSLALTASLLVAYFLLPMLSLLLGRATSSKSDENMEVGVPIEVAPAIKAKNQQLLLLLTLPIFALAYYLTTTLPTRGFPELSRSDYSLEVDWNAPLPLAENLERSAAITAAWRNSFGGQTAALVGEQQFLLAEENRATNNAELQFFLAAPPRQSTFSVQFVDSLRNRYPDARFDFRPLPNLFDRIFLNDRPFLELRLRNSRNRETPEPEAFTPLVDTLNSKGFFPSGPAQREVIVASLNYQQLQISQVDLSRLQERLLTLFGENEVTRLRTNDRALPVLLAGTKDLAEGELLAATVTNRQGAEIPLRYLLKLERQFDYKVLSADRGGEYLPLTFPETTPETAINHITTASSTTPNLTAQLSGRYFTDRGRIRELSGVLLVSLLLLYLILAAQFEGLRLPFVVLLVVPFSLVGALIALWVAGDSLNLLSVIGMVVTGGIVVNDAIIKVDMIERGRREGLDREEAIAVAGRRRLRAIVMTSLTTILALVPVLFTGGLGAELQRPLAITVIGGLLFGTFGSLYLVPPLYRLLTKGAGPRVE